MTDEDRDNLRDEIDRRMERRGLTLSEVAERHPDAAARYVRMDESDAVLFARICDD